MRIELIQGTDNTFSIENSFFSYTSYNSEMKITICMEVAVGQHIQSFINFENNHVYTIKAIGETSVLEFPNLFLRSMSWTTIQQTNIDYNNENADDIYCVFEFISNYVPPNVNRPRLSVDFKLDNKLINWKRVGF